MMLLDSTGNGCVGECTLSPLAHLQPKAASTPGFLRSPASITSRGKQKQVGKVSQLEFVAEVCRGGDG
ncbi:hypothetical protein PBY51_019202 [Eleginops maclovinus]|uniref:Uncharacterized protein n=1 Tax=Eleginops maclovinus TaxID=56733 RepID=A0AAN7Y5W2_ELEMC|nr:hypothetical protein PBY51_019202 [Eleginops maclovinus]